MVLALPVAVNASVPEKVTESSAAFKELQVVQVSLLREGEDTGTDWWGSQEPRASMTQAQLWTL